MGPLSNSKKLLKQKRSYWDDQVEHANYDDFLESARHLRSPEKRPLRRDGRRRLVRRRRSRRPAPRLPFSRRMSPSHVRQTRHRPLGPWRLGRNSRRQTRRRRLRLKNFRLLQQPHPAALLPPVSERRADPKLPTAYVFETGTNVWRQYDAWPPPMTPKSALSIFTTAANSRSTLRPVRKMTRRRFEIRLR